MSRPAVQLLPFSRMPIRSPAVRIASLFVAALFAGEGIAHLIFGATAWTLEDMDAYWNAAMRLRTGEPLYGTSDVNAADVFRYAPWFAMLWVPVTYLPRLAVEVGWSLILIAASVLAVVPALVSGRRAAVTLAALLGPFLVWTASRGNVHPLLVASLVHGLPRAGGPIWLALAASVKATPFAFVLVFVMRRRWRATIVASVLTAALVLPAIAFGIGDYTLDPGGSQSLMFLGWAAWAAAALAALIVAVSLAIRRSRYTAVAAAVAAMALLPRFFLYDLTYLLVATGPSSRKEREL